MEKKYKQLYEFGSLPAPFRLDAGERLLLRAGEAVPLMPKTFDLLLALVEQPGHLLEKETLLKTVWPDTFVEENNLADNISRLRKALAWLEKAYEDRSGWLGLGLKVDPKFDGLRANERFRDLLRRVGYAP